MALPPEPLEDVLGAAAWVVVGEVTAVSQGPALAPAEAPPGTTSTPHAVGSQRVTLEISRVLKGETKTLQTITAEKPVGAYALKPGDKGPFLLDGGFPNPKILGRYGPDTYRIEALEAALNR